MLRGRGSESAVLTALLDGVRVGRSGVLVVRGEAGMGKSALLDHAVASVRDVRVARAAGVESEMELAFAALHQLCGPMLDHLERLPVPQRDALATAFGLHDGPAPDRFLVGLAVLTLLSDVAAERPLVCLVDDAQWLDQASALTLAFVARRLLAEPVIMLFGTRRPGVELRGLPELVVAGLRDADARELLRASVSWRLDEPVRERIIAESRGNPLALLELPRGLSPVELAGGFGLPEALASRIEGSFQNRCQSLPEPTRMLLVIAAAEPVGDPGLAWRAAGRLGIPAEAAAPAAEAGMVEFGAVVRFRHPLVRSAVYRAASPDERRAAHRALADATDPEVDPDRRAWHRSQAASDRDDEVATELEQSAGRAQARGGLAAASAFLRRSAELTADPALRCTRALHAAQVSHEAGAYELAHTLLAMAEDGPLDEVHHAAVELQRAQMAFGGRDAPGLLLAAARRWEPLAPAVARGTYLHALSAGLFAGRLARGAGVGDVARAALAAPPSSGRPSDLLLDGLAGVIAHGHAAGAPLLKEAVSTFRSSEMPIAQVNPWLLWLAAHAAGDLWDDEGWDELNTRHVSLARQVGALTVLPIALTTRIVIHLFAGELDLAASLAQEITTVAEATGSRMGPFGAIAVAAFQGREAEASAMISATRQDLQPRGAGVSLTLMHLSAAVLYNGLGRYRDALGEAQQGAEYPDELSLALWSLPELVEAAARVGEDKVAAGALERLVQTTGPSGTDWALGIEARSRALLSDGEGAERLYREAIERLGRSRFKADLARAHLLYGEWLRREDRRIEAREQLRTAHDMLTAMGIGGFAQRARQELMATGETVRQHTVESVDELTPQELQIATLARGGFSNAEIGSQLFLSARTVEWHLSKVFTKLGLTSRRQLSSALPDGRRAGLPS